MQIQDISSAHLESCNLAIGSFDGVHRGHQALLQSMSGEAKRAGVPAIALTFFPHPAVVLRGWSTPSYLSSPATRAHLLQHAGADIVITQRFDPAFSELRAREFLDLVHKHLSPQEIWIGKDFSFGHKREGNRDFLAEVQGAYGFALRVVEPITLDHEVVSSTRVRSALLAGNVELAGRLLGHSFSIEGKIVHGAGRGRKLGIPTANLDVWAEQLLPSLGVYAGKGWVEGEQHPAVINVGIRPTFDNNGQPLTIEAHLLDFNEDVYDRSLTLEFHNRLRDEQRFNQVDDLRSQIESDIRKTRSILEEEANDG